ncbi:S-adenosyl-L-methionine-dependent methyltransferase [Westerdykella ornata]|uniref:S-adenosyl-L-methionine-dependent methyltransferase n=1 Tax=Westerdykella ornata TaxID=318751 RepID=A0A6A6JGF0_WESOR|nr:S-adenosyl-L-methionine-dependent methyltransferase [Westerdykella ornata]KAF2275345.1 S-adenosyl-L-methionine-dependent methyltransferase [Westerdykella ornata]
MGDDLESYTTSLKSTVLNYRFENGRRYHAFQDDEGKYMFPNDDEESDRLDLYHHIETLSLGGELHLAPIGDHPGRILDLGTGTGIWAIDMGTPKYPGAEILGNDISPIQPTLVPPNVKFEVDDIENDWVYTSKFDFIHARYLACSIRDWPKLMSQAYKFTKPGGWVEFQDYDLNFYTTTGTYKPDSALGLWAQKIDESVSKYGIEPSPGPKLEQWVKDAGFVNVVAKVFPLPMGTWPKDARLKEIGAFNLISVLDNLEGVTLRAFTTAHGWSPEEVKVLCAKVRTTIKEKSARIQHNFYVVYGQKPENAAG